MTAGPKLGRRFCSGAQKRAQKAAQKTCKKRPVSIQFAPIQFHFPLARRPTFFAHFSPITDNRTQTENKTTNRAKAGSCGLQPDTWALVCNWGRRLRVTCQRKCRGFCAVSCLSVRVFGCKKRLAKSPIGCAIGRKEWPKEQREWARSQQVGGTLSHARHCLPRALIVWAHHHRLLLALVIVTDLAIWAPNQSAFQLAFRLLPEALRSKCCLLAANSEPFNWSSGQLLRPPPNGENKKVTTSGPQTVSLSPHFQLPLLRSLRSALRAA